MYLLFDIGGTNMRLALSQEGRKIDEIEIVETPQDFKKGILKFKKTAQKLTDGTKIKAVAGGAAGPLDKDKATLLSPPQLHDWFNRPLKKELENAVGAPVYLENDVALVGLGEATYGAGKGFSIVVYYIVGSGINGVRLVDGKIDRNAMGFEVGHQIINPQSPFQDGLGISGTLEAYVGGANVEKRFSKKPYQIKNKEIWDELAAWLALGLNNTIVHWSPEVIVLGGSMMKEVGIPMDRVRYHLKRTLKRIFPENQHPPLKKAELGDAGGLWGALAYLNQQNPP